MYVIKRDGRHQSVHFDKITSRITQLCYGLNREYVDPATVAQKVCLGVYKGVTTTELDELAAETAAHMTANHPDHGLLAARIAVSNLHKNTLKSFSATMKLLHEYVDARSGQPAPMIDDKVYAFIVTHAEALDAAIVHTRDFTYDYFGFKTLERSYLLRVAGSIVERVQHMIMRVACGIHSTTNVAAVLETYELMSGKWFTHATPTLFNSGTRIPQLSSCFLKQIKCDSINGIYTTLLSTALISKSAGGVGLAVSRVRAKGSYIRGTNGNSNGIVPMLRVFNSTARYVDQGGGRRKGAFAIYLEPWHADVFAWLELKKNHGMEEERARDLFYALWVPDLFMKRVDTDGDWSLFCPNEAPGLTDCYGEEFETLYEQYEKQNKARKVIKARALWQEILTTQMEVGMPFFCFKDSANSKSNQKNSGIIQCSNLCTEIMENTSANESAVCNLASIALPMFVDEKTKTFDFYRLGEITRVVTRNLNHVIDINFYPVEETARSNLNNRPIGIGVQGLADVFIKLRMPFDSDEARQLNKDIFECIYFAAVSMSHQLAVEQKETYPSFKGSPMSKGVFQFDMWNVVPSKRWNWQDLREKVMANGVRNSLLVALMPTASTSQILGWNEAFEPYTSNLYTRRTLAGEFVCVNNHLLQDLIGLGIWNEQLKNKIIACNGSIQAIPEIPGDIKQLYRTVWEISQKSLVTMSAERGPFVDQSQSLNIHMQDANYAKLTSLHFHAWRSGLKTGMYYLRTKSAADAIKFTVDPQMVKDMQNQQNNQRVTTLASSSSSAAEELTCSLDNPQGCLMCSS